MGKNKRKRTAENKSKAREKRFRFQLRRLVARASSDPVVGPPRPGDAFSAARSLEGWDFILTLNIEPESSHAWHLSAKLVPHGRPSCPHDWKRLGTALALVGAPDDEEWQAHVIRSFEPDQAHHFRWTVTEEKAARGVFFTAAELAVLEEHKARVRQETFN